MVRDRAVTDLDCPKSDIVVSSLGEDSYSAKGCSREQGYTCTGRVEGPRSCWPDSGFGNPAAHAVAIPEQREAPIIVRPDEDPVLPPEPNLNPKPVRAIPAAVPVVKIQE